MLLLPTFAMFCGFVWLFKVVRHNRGITRGVNLMPAGDKRKGGLK